jgi:hypothetical protein
MGSESQDLEKKRATMERQGQEAWSALEASDFERAQ